MASEAITRNDLMAILNEVLPSAAVDYIVEQGTSGIWTYRKWASGLYDAWYEGTINILSGTAMGGGYYHASSSSLNPPSFSVSVTSFYGTNRSDVLFAYVGHSGTYTTYWWNASSGALNNIPVRLDMHGRWK